MRTVQLNLRALLLGDESRQRMRASQSLLVLLVYAVFSLVLHGEVMVGLVDEAAAWPLTAWDLGGSLCFYLVIRSGINQRLRRDRSLSVPQTLWALVSIAYSYAITGPARGAVILTMMLVIMFGMFALTPTQARRLSALSFAVLASAMLVMALTDPVRYDPRVEFVHFLYTAIVMAAVSTLAIRIGKLRARLESQRSELAHALERIQLLATCDGLTGLLNRRAVMERLQAELRERDAQQPRLSVALIDLDHFKRVNDSHGHAAGDEVLRRFAEVTRQEVRGTDLVARWGGEEFLLMMPGANAALCLQGLERIRLRLRSVSMDDIATGMQVTFSAGVSECWDERDLDSAIERADAAMYEAKRSGRDRSMANVTVIHGTTGVTATAQGAAAVCFAGESKIAA